MRAEREQGITIDVAYRFFSTENRSYILADTPGHERYTRNTFTGASNAHVAVLLVDARKGLLRQTRRHARIATLVGVPHIVAAVNKIDLAGYSKETFDRIVGDYTAFASQLGFTSIMPIPLSARFGDNVTELSGNTPWFRGPSLIEYLETIDVESDAATKPFRFPVQWVNRPNLDFRGYTGTAISGSINVGDPIVVAASGKLSHVKEILTYEGPQPSATAGDAVTITLTDEVDIARGDLLVNPTSRPEVSDQFAAHLIWMSEEQMVPGRSYLARIGTKSVPVTITSIKHKIDVNTREHLATHTLGLNDIAFCNLSTSVPVAFDPYEQNRRTGAFIIIDRFNNHTVGAGMISFGLRRGTNIHWQPLLIGKAERGPAAIEAIKQHKSAYLMAVGGAAYLVSKAIKTAKVVGFEDLGMEAIYEFDVVDMPVTVAVDAGGTSAHITGPAEWEKRIASGEFKGIAVSAA